MVENFALKKYILVSLKSPFLSCYFC